MPTPSDAADRATVGGILPSAVPPRAGPPPEGMVGTLKLIHSRASAEEGLVGTPRLPWRHSPRRHSRPRRLFICRISLSVEPIGH